MLIAAVLANCTSRRMKRFICKLQFIYFLERWIYQRQREEGRKESTAVWEFDRSPNSIELKGQWTGSKGRALRTQHPCLVQIYTRIQMVQSHQDVCYHDGNHCCCISNVRHAFGPRGGTTPCFIPLTKGGKKSRYGSVGMGWIWRNSKTLKFWKLLADAQITVIKKEEAWIKRCICLVFQFDPIPCCVICDDLDNNVLANDDLLNWLHRSTRLPLEDLISE